MEREARSDVSMLVDSRDEVPREVAASDATSAPAVAPWELADARAKLKEWTLARLLATRPVAEPVVFRADTTIGEALRRFADAGILSAPVLDAVDNQPPTDFLGFLDVADVLTSLIKELYAWLLDEPHRSTAHGMMAALAADTQSVTDVMKDWARELFLLRWVRTIRPGDDGDFLYRGLGYKTLLDVITRGLQNLPVGMRPWGDLKPSHRIAVFDLVDEPPPGALPRIGGQPERITITHVVSQTDLVAFLLFQAQEGNLGTALPQRTVASLGWVRRDVVTVPSNMPTIAAFALMLNRGVSGAGVTDAARGDEADVPLISSLSVSDIRVLHRAADFDALALPVADFLLYHYGAAPPVATGGGADASAAAAASGASATGAAIGPPSEAAATAMAAQVAAMEVSQVGGAAVEVVTSVGVAATLPSANAVEAAMETAAQPPAPRLWLVRCAPESTLREVLEKMVFNSVHRVYITDAEQRPLGVVTMSDVLQLVAVDPDNDAEGWLDSPGAAF